MKKEIAKPIKSIEVKLSTSDIAKTIGEVCSSSYGVFGLTKTKTSKDQPAEILDHNNYIEGILFSKVGEKYVVDVHVVVAYGVKISEVVSELSKGILYTLNKKYGKIFSKVNIFVEELRDL